MPRKKAKAPKRKKIRAKKPKKLLRPSASKRLEEHYKDAESGGPPKIIKSKISTPLGSKKPKKAMLGSRILKHDLSDSIKPAEEPKKKVKLKPLDLPIEAYEESRSAPAAKAKPKQPDEDSLESEMLEFTKAIRKSRSDKQNGRLKSLLTNLEGLEGIPSTQKPVKDSLQQSHNEQQIQKNEPRTSTKLLRGDYRLDIKERRERHDGLYIFETLVILALIIVFLAILIDAEIVSMGVDLPFDLL